MHDNKEIHDTIIKGHRYGLFESINDLSICQVSIYPIRYGSYRYIVYRMGRPGTRGGWGRGEAAGVTPPSIPGTKNPIRPSYYPSLQLNSDRSNCHGVDHSDPAWLGVVRFNSIRVGCQPRSATIRSGESPKIVVRPV